MIFGVRIGMNPWRVSRQMTAWLSGHGGIAVPTA